MTLKESKMKYTEMTMDEIFAIVNKGGDKKVELDRMVSDHLRGLTLSDKAKGIIADTGMDCMAETFGGLFTAEEVEKAIDEYEE